MLLFRPLPWDYGIRNLMRRPLRTGLTLLALGVVTLLVLVVIGFVRGLDRSLSTSGDPQTVIVFSLGMGENLEYSSVPARTADLLAASVQGIERRQGGQATSPELYLGTRIWAANGQVEGQGLVRGVTNAVIRVHTRFQIDVGQWPQTGEVLVGRLTATKLGLEEGALHVGDQLEFEGRKWRISGVFSAAGGTFESEVWSRLDDLQQALKRQDLSLVAVRLRPETRFQVVDLFCKERLDLELQALRQTEYFASLRKDYAPVRWLAWLVVLLIAGAGVFVGLNTMYGAVAGRVRELAMLQTLGFSRRAAILSLVQEGLLLSMTGALAASLLAYALVNGLAVRFTMGAFRLEIDGLTLLIGNGVALALGVGGALPPALRVCRLSVVESLKAV